MKNTTLYWILGGLVVLAGGGTAIYFATRPSKEKALIEGGVQGGASGGANVAETEEERRNRAIREMAAARGIAAMVDAVQVG